MADKGKPGIYEAKVTDFGVGTTKKGDPMAMVRFGYVDSDGDSHSATWYGTFGTEKSSEISCETLAVCGYTSNNLADLAKGAGSGVLDENRVVSLTLANDTYEGVTRLKIKYVNPPGGAGFRSSLEHSEAVKAFKGVNIGAAMAMAKKKHQKTIVNHAPVLDTDEEIAF